MKLKEITYKDRSEFLRGFATIIRKNNYGNADLPTTPDGGQAGQAGEKTMFLTIGNYFGFEKEFCEEALERLFVNKYISEHPAVFSNKPIAEFFISDVAKIMLHTNSMTDASKEWLLKTAEANNVGFSLSEFD